MKKVLIICLTVVMILSMGVSVFAASTNFVSSPSGNEKFEMVSVEKNDVDYSASVIITQYAERKNVSEEIRKSLEDAYGTIAEAESLTILCPDLKGVAKSEGISSSDLAISELFDIRCIGGNIEQGIFTITLGARTFKGFISLLYLKDDEWTVAKNAKVEKVEDKYHLTFESEGYYPYAIVVSTSEKKPPKTGDNSIIYTMAGIMLASAAALFVCAVKSKKKA